MSREWGEADEAVNRASSVCDGSNRDDLCPLGFTHRTGTSVNRNRHAALVLTLLGAAIGILWRGEEGFILGTFAALLGGATTLSIFMMRFV